MSYRVGDVDVQGEQPSNIINVAFTPKTTDGGKVRIRSGRMKFRIPASPTADKCDDLVMDHADNGMPSDSAYSAPDWDPA